MSEKVYLTNEGLKKLEDELHELRHNKRPSISIKVNEARELGDLKENAEYHAAREELSMCETRIQQIQGILSRFEIINTDSLNSDEIRILSHIKLENKNNGKLFEYTIVSQEEADLKTGKISINSPVAQGLLGHKKGDEVEVQVPAGKLKFKILDISV